MPDDGTDVLDDGDSGAGTRDDDETIDGTPDVSQNDDTPLPRENANNNSAKFRNVAFTSFKSPDQDSRYDYLLNLVKPDGPVNYICFGIELAPTTGRAHIQGYLELKSQQRLPAVKRLLDDASAHIESARGTAAQNRVYCKKDGRFFERGQPKQAGKRSDLESVKSAIKSGASLKDVREGWSQVYARYPRFIQEYYTDHRNAPRTARPTVLWLHGATGSGKTSFAYTKFRATEIHLQSLSMHWWTGYDGQRCTVLDEFRKDCIKTPTMLMWLDAYPCQVPVRYGDRYLNSPFIIITSCEHPRNYFDDIEWPQIERRLTAVLQTPLEESMYSHINFE